MTEVHHFSYGLVTPVAAYLMSFVGSLLGLLCTARARATTGRSRASWLGLAALAIGGTGIWVMHFIAMLGFSIPNTEIRYDVPLTLLSCATAIVVVAIGLFIVGFAGDGVPAVVTGGVLTGIGVASMHYTGMTAMKMGGEIGYQPALVALSVVIALVAATAALWFALKVRGLLPTAGAALIMGVAVTGMHYTGMAAMRVTLHEHAHGAPSGGVEPTDFLLPLVGGVGAVATILLVIIAMAPSEDEMRVEAQLQERLAARRDRPQPSAPASPGGPTGSADAAGRGRTAGEWFGGGTPRP